MANVTGHVCKGKLILLTGCDDILVELDEAHDQVEQFTLLVVDN